MSLISPLSTAKRLEEIEKLVETTKKEGAKVSNGSKMLLYQAEKAWELWNNK